MANQGAAEARQAAPAAVLRTGRLARSSAGNHPRALEYAVVDVETTGLDPVRGARVCEIAVVRMRGDGTVLREFATLVDPVGPVTGREFHGIGDADVRGAPRARDLVGELSQLFSGAVVVGHKLEFEEQFLAAEFVPAGLARGLPGLCTLQTLRAQVDLRRYSLPRASYALAGRWPSGQHTALGDARATALLLAELLHNAPAPLSYVGAAPVRLSGAGFAAVRLKPRQSGVGHGTDRELSGGVSGTGVLRVPLARWPARWREVELDPHTCGGRFGGRQRARALARARARGRARVVVRTAAAWTVGAAAAGVLAMGTRGLSRRVAPTIRTGPGTAR